MLKGKRKILAVTVAVMPEQATLFPEAATTSLYQKKVELLIARYLFFVTQGKKSDETLTLLENEFFISTERIADIIESHIEDIKALRQQAPKKSWFQTQWAHLIW